MSLITLAVTGSAAPYAFGAGTHVRGRPADVMRRLTGLSDAGLSPTDRAKLGLELYQQEMFHPTPRPKPPYTDFRTHDYVLAQITRKLVEVKADVPTLRAVWQTANPGEVKDSLALFLLLSGEKDLKEPVMALARDRRRPLRLRELAVEALGGHALAERDASLGRVLAEILREDTHQFYKWDRKSQPLRLMLVYPVKRAAAGQIKRLSQAGLKFESFVIAAAEQVTWEVPLPEAAQPRPEAPARTPAAKGRGSRR